MKSPTLKEDVLVKRKYFGSLDQEALGKWLWKGLTVLYSSPPLYSCKGFAPADGYFGFGESNLDDLREIYRSIFDKPTQERFRRAMRDLLEAHKGDAKVKREVIRDVTSLIERVRTA